MYSVVLMMAMTSGADMPVDGLLHRGSCNGGCSGSYSGACYGGGYGGSCYGGYCSGSYGSCNGGSCHGGHHMFGGGGMLFGGHHHSCNGGGYCSGSYGGSCYGSCGCYCSGSYSGACSGGYYGGGCGGGYMAPPPPPPMDKKEKKEIGEVTEPTAATIIVTLPAEAKLLVDGAATKSTSAERTFVSPALLPGSTYHYTLRAEFTKDGQPVSVTKTVEVRAGIETRVTIDMSEAVAAR